MGKPNLGVIMDIEISFTGNGKIVYATLDVKNENEQD